MPAAARSQEEFEDRFWAKVSKGDGCWLWMGAKNRLGYGSVRRRPHVLAAHRLSYELTYGPIRDGLWVLHRCDTPSCVRPDHLFLGTQRENNDDCTTKGRRRKEGTAVAKVSADDVRAIRLLYRDGATQHAIAARYGLSQTTISHIVTLRTWAWVD